jgi:hypothetical protein
LPGTVVSIVGLDWRSCGTIVPERGTGLAGADFTLVRLLVGISGAPLPPEQAAAPATTAASGIIE